MVLSHRVGGLHSGDGRANYEDKQREDTAFPLGLGGEQKIQEKTQCTVCPETGVWHYGC